MKYKVEYYSSNGTPSDNIFIGIYNTIEEAKIARKEFIEENVGTYEEFCNWNYKGIQNSDSKYDYEQNLKDFNGNTIIEKIL